MRSVLAAVAIWAAQTTPAPGAVPDNPCELLTVAQVEQASGLKVINSRRVRSRGEDLQTPPPPGSICHYETAAYGLISWISLAVQRPPVATPAAYREARDSYFATYAGSGRAVPGVGQDAYIRGGAIIVVLVRDDLQFWVMVQHADSGDVSAGILTSVAKVLVRRLGS